MGPKVGRPVNAPEGMMRRVWVRGTPAILPQLTDRRGRQDLAVSPPDDPSARAARLLNEIEALLRRGDKIGAIKAYRTATGTGLKDAKDTVDAVERAMQAQGQIEARPGGLLAQITQAVARWRGTNT